MSGNQFTILESLNLAVARFQEGRLDLAETLCRKVLAADKKNANALYLLGVIAHHADRPKDAIRLISKSLKVEPGNAEAHNYLGVVLAETGRHSEAVRRFRNSLKLMPNLPEAFNNLGNALKELGRLEEAAQNFRQAIALRRDYVEAFNGLGCCLSDLAQSDEAIVVLRQAIEIRREHPDAHFNLGNVLAGVDRQKEAVECYEKAIALDPAFEDAYYNLIKSLHLLGHWESSAAYARKVLVLVPESARGHHYLGVSCAATDATDEARCELERALQLCDDPMLKTEILLALSRLPNAELTEDHLAAIDALVESDLNAQTASNEFSIDTKLAFARGAVLDRLGRYEEAWESYRNANEAIHEAQKAESRSEQSGLNAVRRNAQDWVARSKELDLEPPNGAVSLFILGPSRSGKTTLETLAGSLDRVSNSHESPIVTNALVSAFGSATNATPSQLCKLLEENHTGFANHYRKILETAIGTGSVLSNTHPENIAFVGWLAQFVPNCRFVFMERNEDDLSVRIFTRIFDPCTNYYAYDLDAIRHYISWYSDMYDIWQSRLDDVVLRLSYEDMIANPNQTRDAIARLCGMPPTCADTPVLGDDRGVAKPYERFLKTGAT